MNETDIQMTVDGKSYTLPVRNHQTLCDVLVKQLKKTGPREVCGLGICGACTVLENGQPVATCVQLALLADGTEIVTTEGLARDGELDPVQEAFIETGAFQCGYCTPGMIMTARALLNENPRPAEPEIRRYMAGNLCRCTSYYEIIDAILKAAERDPAPAKH